MGQAIVTSHSPYVIEQFEPEDIVMLHREGAGTLVGTRPDSGGFKPKSYRAQRRQFAEAILARAVVVTEGPTESALLPVASSILEDEGGAYTHFDLAGVSIFTAEGDGDVPRWGQIFKALGKKVYGLRDKQSVAPTPQVQQQLAEYDHFWESPEKGLELLLINQTTAAVHRRFLAAAVERDDYPSGVAKYAATMTEGEVTALAMQVLMARKGDGYAYGALFVEHCQSAADLPDFLRTVLTEIDEAMRPPISESGASVAGSSPAEASAPEGGESTMAASSEAHDD